MTNIVVGIISGIGGATFMWLHIFFDYKGKKKAADITFAIGGLLATLFIVWLLMPVFENLLLM